MIERIEGINIVGIDTAVMEIGIIDIGVNVIDGMEGSVIEICVYVSVGSVGTAPSDPSSVQPKSTQQLSTPLTITQWRPGSQYLPLLQQVWPLTAQYRPSQQFWPSWSGQHPWES